MENERFLKHRLHLNVEYLSLILMYFFKHGKDMVKVLAQLTLEQLGLNVEDPFVLYLAEIAPLADPLHKAFLMDIARIAIAVTTNHEIIALDYRFGVAISTARIIIY